MLLPADLILPVFLLGTFVAAIVTGVAGFAFGLVALAIWLQALTPLQAAPLVAAYALLVQGYAVWKLRHALDWPRLMPFLVGSVLGVPAGIALLSWAPQGALRLGVGILLILFSVYSLARPQLQPRREAGWWSDAAVGWLNGVVGGSTGLAGILVVIWCSLRGWPRDQQRAVFQPTAVVSFVAIILGLGGGGMLSPETARLFAIGLPALAAGTWLGWTLYGKVDEARFRWIVLVVLLLCGVALVAAGM
jgi:uncharacterized membrane protein YfcA